LLGLSLAIHLLGFLMMVQEGCIGPKEAHSLIYSLEEFEREHGDENGGIS
jgi:hypothetical protein